MAKPAKKRTKKYKQQKPRQPMLLPLPVPTITAPKYIDYLNTRFDLANQQFLEAIENALKTNDKIIISFRNTKILLATAALVIYSILDTHGKGKTISIILSSTSDSVNSCIKNCGGFQSPEKRMDTLNNKTGIPVILGNNAEVIALQKKIIDTVVELYLDKEAPNFTDRRFEIGIAIQETLDNVGRHAYPEMNHEDRLWWFCCDMIEDKLFIAIYDAGRGIPNAILQSDVDYAKLIEMYYEDVDSAKTQLKDLPAPTVTAHLRETIADEALIRAAMSSELSTTKKDKHGKGSSRIKALIKNEKESFLLIFSCKGLYQYSLFKEDGDDEPEITFALQSHLNGTLIQWSL